MMKNKLIEKKYLATFIIITALFALWGFANDITNPMVAAFQTVMELSAFQASWVQCAFYGGYATMAIPAALFIRKFSYKSGILLGLGLYAIGAFLFIPAASMQNFLFFCLSLYILTFGLAFLETTANPFILSLGSKDTSTRRLNFAQAFNPLGSLSGMAVASLIVLPSLWSDHRNAAGETVFHTLSKARAEEIALFFSGSMVLLVKLLTPVSAIFSVISKLLSKLLAGKETKTVTEEELLSIIETIEDEGVLEPEKQALVNSAIEFRDKLAEDIMIPMDQVVCVNVATPIEQLVETVQAGIHSRLPVYERNKDNIVGILPVNLFLSQYVTGKKVPLRKILLKPYIFDSKTEISVLLQRMRLNKLHMVFLVDEHRKKVGILTMPSRFRPTF